MSVDARHCGQRRSHVRVVGAFMSRTMPRCCAPKKAQGREFVLSEETRWRQGQDFSYVTEVSMIHFFMTSDCCVS